MGPTARRSAVLLATLALTLLPACVTRRLLVESEPPGAEVRLDGHLVGTTPYQETFLSYGVRQVDLRAEDSLRHVQEYTLVRPWWQVFPFGVLADLLWPADLLDEHTLKVELLPRGTAATTWKDAEDAQARFRRVRQQMADRAAAFDGRPELGVIAPPDSAADDSSTAPGDDGEDAEAGVP